MRAVAAAGVVGSGRRDRSRRLVFLDESGVTTEMTRRYGRARARSGCGRRPRQGTGAR